MMSKPVQFYITKELVCELPMNSTPSLDISFKHDGKFYKVCKVTQVKDTYECQVNEITEDGKIIRKGES